MIGIFVSMVACGGGGNNIEGTYVSLKDGRSLTFSTGNELTITYFDGERDVYVEGTYELIVEHKEKKMSRGMIILKTEEFGRDMYPYTLEGNRLTIDDTPFIKK